MKRVTPQDCGTNVVCLENDYKKKSETNQIFSAP